MINRKQLYTNQTCSRWKKVNKMRYLTAISDLNVAQIKITSNFYLGNTNYISDLVDVTHCDPVSLQYNLRAKTKLPRLIKAGNYLKNTEPYVDLYLDLYLNRFFTCLQG